MSKPRRVLLKMSGEALRSSTCESVIDTSILSALAVQIQDAVKAGIEVAIVVGGGNIYRGAIGQQLGMDRVRGDYMGMTATVINALAIESALELQGVPAETQSAISIGRVALDFDQPGAIKALEKGKVVVLGGGTGNPYFTTDTAAALRAVELKCDTLLKATKVDGVYSADPVTNPDAELFSELSFEDVLSRNLRVMDQTAFSLCRENGLPIQVFNLAGDDNVRRSLMGERVGTLVH